MQKEWREECTNSHTLAPLIPLDGGDGDPFLFRPQLFHLGFAPWLAVIERALALIVHTQRAFKMESTLEEAPRLESYTKHMLWLTAKGPGTTPAKIRHVGEGSELASVGSLYVCQ